MDSAPLLVLILLLGFALVASCQVTTGWQPAQCVPADVPMQELYDVAQVVDDFEAGEQAWQTFQGEQNATNTIALCQSEYHSGSASLRVDYEFVGNRPLEYIQLSPGFPISEPGYGVGYWLKTDGTRFLPRLRVDDVSGETHQLELTAGKEAGWQFAVVELNAPSSFWGGDGNGKLDYPLTFNGILFDRPSREWAGQGSLWIDEVTLVTRHPVTQTLQVDVENKRFGNLYTLGEPVALRASGLGERLSWSVKDYFGVEIASGEGPAAQVRADFSLEQPGYYECRFTLTEDGRQTEQVVFSMAALTAEARPASSDFVGVNCHFGQNAYPLECMDLLVRYGVSRFRDECGWGGVETVKGQYALPPHCQAYYAKAKEVGLKPLTILDYSNGLYDEGGFPNSEEAIAGFANYGRALAQLTEGTVDNFEVWNEWIGGCGMGGRPGDHGPEAYGRLLKTTYETIKTDFPDVTVVGVGGEYGTDCAEVVSKMVETAGPDSMDAWSIHPYRYPTSPEASHLYAEVGRIRDEVVSRRSAEASLDYRNWLSHPSRARWHRGRGPGAAGRADVCLAASAGRHRALLLVRPEGRRAGAHL